MKLLLLLPFVGLLLVPVYNKMAPELWGIPYFYWYQLAWVPLTSILLWVVDRATRREVAPISEPLSQTIAEREVGQ